MRKRTSLKIYHTYVLRLIVILIMLFSNGCSVLFSSVESDKKTGAEMAKQVESQMGLYNSPTTNKYIEEIGQRLVKELDKKEFDFQFNIADQQEPNAFALPGGYVYFTRGILVLANNEDEIANVMGHEISHIIQRHSAKQAKRSILPALLEIPGALVGTFANEDLGNLLTAPVDILGKVSLAHYSRKQESEADELGMRLAAKAGYNPRELGVMLEQIEKYVEMETGHKSEFSFFNSHPTTPDRIEYIEKEVTNINWKPHPEVVREKKDFLNKLDGLIYGKDPAQGIFKKEKYIHPDIGFVITFPKGWKTANTPSATGAYTEEQDGVIFINGVGKATDPKVIGESFIKKIKEKYNVIPEKAESIKINFYPAYLVSFADKSNKNSSHYYYLWITMGKLTYQLIGGGLDKYKQDLREAVLSMHPITKTERNSVMVNRVRIVKAKKGEALSELCSRTGNVWSPEYTAMINAISKDDKMAEGKLIKIAKKERY